MKFGDKLIELRKKNGYSQEELAEKLGVSRQSVSKWESNNTYPETDKIIQIANLFDCSMDDLINDKITDVESTQRKNKSNVKNIWNSFLGFITDTIDMFSKMKFLEGLKCIIVILLLGFILNIAGIIICNIVVGIITSIFSFLSPEIISTIRGILKGIFHLIWFIISAIAIIHAFKIKYLNKYIYQKEITNKTDEKDNIKIEKEIADEKPFEFLEVLAKTVIIFIKFIAIWIILGTAFTTIGLVIGSVVSLTYITANILFLWIFLLLLAATTASILIIILLIKFIFNKKVNVIPGIIVFLSCIVLSGLSIGMLALTIKNIEVVDDNSVLNIEEKTIELQYKDNLVIESNGVGLSNSYKYIIDNSIEDNKIIISRQIDPKYFYMTTYETTMDKLPVIKVNEYGKNDLKAYYELFIKNLKKNRVISFNNYGNDPLVLKANENTVNKLISSLKLLYLVDETKENNEINILIKDYRVYFKGDANVEYNALEDSVKLESENQSCKKEIEVTEYGERIIYTCDYNEEE